MVTNNYTPYKGGVVHSIQTSADALRAQGHRVIIVTLSLTNTDAVEKDVIRIPAIMHFTYKKNPVCIPHSIDRVLRTTLREYAPTIIHSHHPFLLGTHAAQVAQAHKIPLIFTHHTQYHAYAHYVPLPERLTQRYIRAAVAKYHAQTTHIIAPSTSVAETINHPCSIVPSCIRDELLHATKPIKPQGIPHLITVSRFVPEKNIPFLLHAYSLLPAGTYRFTLYGYGHALDQLKELAYVTYKLDPQLCTFVEHPSPQELRTAYAQAHLFIFASHTETQGLVVAESLAAGTPVIAVDAPGVRDAVTHESGFLVHTAYELAYRIQYALDPVRYEALSQAAWESAHRYSKERHAKQLLTIYNEVTRKFLNCHGSS